MLSKMEVQGQQVARFTQYDNAHRVIMTAAPSAVAAG
jgi:hypothetical protein